MLKNVVKSPFLNSNMFLLENAQLSSQPRKVLNNLDCGERQRLVHFTITRGAFVKGRVKQVCSSGVLL